MAENDEEKREEKTSLSEGNSYLVLSQFAYSMVIVTVVLGLLGRWIGNALLGGRPWDVILLILFGLLGFGGELYRMVKTAEAITKKENAKREAANKHATDKKEPEEIQPDLYDDDEDD